MQVDGEDVEMLLAFGEKQTAEGHVAAWAGDDELIVMVDQAAPQQRRKPVAPGVAPHLDARGRDVVDRPWAPVDDLCEATARPVLQVKLELSRVQRVAGDQLGETVLTQPQIAAAVGDRERVRVLRGAAGADLIDNLERLGDLQSRRHVQERPAAPECRAGGLELVAVEREPAHVVALEKLAVLARGLLEGAEQHAALG